MSGETKITLSEDELALVTNADWILTKQLITQKVYALLSAQIPAIRSALLNRQTHLPAAVIQSVPKIYKGESYLQLPYVMLDYPRCFDKEDIFAIRTMFWWANFFSITLHLSGKYKCFLKEDVYKNELLKGNNFFVGVNDNQWQHHFNEDNFLPYDKLTTGQQIKSFEKNKFIKLALKFDLQQWSTMDTLLNDGYKKIAALIS